MGTFLPCPPELKATVAGCVGSATEPAQIALEAQEAQNVELFGARNWYEWQIGHWGTKWDVGRETDQSTRRLSTAAKQLTFSFNSAWSPPIEFFNHLHRVEGFDITAYFFEPGVGFCGVYRDGKSQDFHTPCDREDLEKLPPDLIKAFALDEWVQNEYETETNDEEEH